MPPSSQSVTSLPPPGQSILTFFPHEKVNGGSESILQTAGERVTLFLSCGTAWGRVMAVKKKKSFDFWRAKGESARWQHCPGTRLGTSSLDCVEDAQGERRLCRCAAPQGSISGPRSMGDAGACWLLLHRSEIPPVFVVHGDGHCERCRCCLGGV